MIHLLCCLICLFRGHQWTGWLPAGPNQVRWCVWCQAEETEIAEPILGM